MGAGGVTCVYTPAFSHKNSLSLLYHLPAIHGIFSHIRAPLPSELLKKTYPTLPVTHPGHPFGAWMNWPKLKCACAWRVPSESNVVTGSWFEGELDSYRVGFWTDIPDGLTSCDL